MSDFFKQVVKRRLAMRLYFDRHGMNSRKHGELMIGLSSFNLKLIFVKVNVMKLDGFCFKGDR